MAPKVYTTATTFLLLHVMALPVLAGGSVPSFPESRWHASLKEIDQKLRAHQWEAAESQLLRVSDQIVEQAGASLRVAYNLAATSGFRAIAEAALGREEEANWHWDMALNLSPEMANMDLSPYGPVVADLKKRRLRTVDPNRESSQVVDEPGNLKSKLQPPRIVRQVQPIFPPALRRFGVIGSLTVEAVVGEDGVPREPLVIGVRGGGPAMGYVVLEALRQWRFEPARLDGKLIEVYYMLIANFPTDGNPEVSALGYRRH